MAPTRLAIRLVAYALAALAVVAAQCSGSTYSYGSGACASCAAGASFISSSAGCKPSATLTSGPADTALYLSGSQAEGVAAFAATGAAPSYAADVFGNAGGALVLATGAHLDVVSGTSAPPALPSGNVAWSASAWVKCAAPTTWAAVFSWGAEFDGSAVISASSPRASALVVGGLVPRASGALVTTVVCSLRNPAFIVVIPETSMVVVALEDVFEYWLVSLAGTISRLAGNANIGNGGYVDGVGGDARFNYVGGVAPLNTSMLVVADTGNHCIRLITYPGGEVTSLAGRCGPYTGNADGTGTNALFFYPGGVAVIPSNSVIVVADTNNGRIRLVTPLGSVTTLGAATGASFVSPVAVAIVPSSGSIVVVGRDHRVRLVTYPAGVVTTIAGSGNAAFADGLGTAASFSSPSGVAVIASTGVIAVADFGNNRVRLVTPLGDVTTLAGSGSASAADGTGNAAGFNQPRSLAIFPASGAIAVADFGNQCLRLISIPQVLPACDLTWHHVALTYSPSGSPYKLSAFLDGALVFQQAATLMLPARADSTLRIGWSGNLSVNSGSLFAGVLTELRMYSSSLTATEVVVLSQPPLTAFAYTAVVPAAPSAGASTYAFSCASPATGNSGVLTKSGADGSWAWASGLKPSCGVSPTPSPTPMSATPSQTGTPTPSRTPTASRSASPLPAPAAGSVMFGVMLPGGSPLLFVRDPSLGVQLRAACASLLAVANATSAFSVVGLMGEPAGDFIGGNSAMNARVRRRGLQVGSSVVVTLSIDTTNAAVASVFGTSPSTVAAALRLAFADARLVSGTFASFAVAWASASGSSAAAVLAGLSLGSVRLPSSLSVPAPAVTTDASSTSSSSGVVGGGIAAAVFVVSVAALGLWWRRQQARSPPLSEVPAKAHSDPVVATNPAHARSGRDRQRAHQPISRGVASSENPSVALPPSSPPPTGPTGLEIRVPASDVDQATPSAAPPSASRDPSAPSPATRRGSESGLFSPAAGGSVSLEWESIKPDSGGFAPEKGAQGFVFRARGRKVQLAVKVLKGLSGAESARIKSELHKEAELLARASAKSAENEHVVEFYGIVEGEAPPEWVEALGSHSSILLFRPPSAKPSQPASHMIGMVTLWQAGGDLDSRLHARSADVLALGLRDRLRLVGEVAAGLVGLHRQNIVHADLKPANVLLSAVSDPHARLADFGLARLTDAVTTSVQSKASFMASTAQKADGTWPYMAPELHRHKPQNEKAEKPSRRSDVYAFGVLAWELLSARKPWVSDEGEMPTESEHVVALYRGGPGATLNVNLLPVEASQAVRTCIAECLSFDKSKRPNMGVVQVIMEQAYTEATSGTFDIFLSYAWGSDSARRPFTLELHRALTRAGLRVWIDHRPDGSGQMGYDMKASMRKGIADSKIAVVLMSSDYANSKNCGFELDTIVDLKKPLVICTVEPGFWKTWMSADHRVALKSGLAGGSKLYVDLGKAAALPWAMPDEPGGQAKASLAALYDSADALPLLLRLVKEASEA
jgi:serine/threonine protein kinase